MFEAKRLRDPPDWTHLPATQWSWLNRFRRQARGAFCDQGLPTTRQEAWKYTHLGDLDDCAFHIDFSTARGGDERSGEELPTTTAKSATAKSITPTRAFSPEAHYLEFHAGHFSAAHSWIGVLPAGAKLLPLHQALLEERPLIRSHLGRLAAHQEQPFAALNSSWLADGLLLYLPTGCQLSEPVHCHFQGPDEGAPQACFPRLLIILEAGAQATLVETYAGSATDSGHLTDSLCEIRLAEAASLLHGRYLAESPKGRHIAGTVVEQAAGSRYQGFSLTLGAGLGRTDLQIRLQGDGAQSQLDGLYLLTGRQHLDHHLRIDHYDPGCRSEVLYKGVLYDRARGVFNGKAVVHPDAQRSDARQVNKNLLLSQGAEMDTKPELQIEADDVKCSHGATVGYLDQDALFYLNSRGLGLDEARSLLVLAFATEVLDRLPSGPLQEWMQRAVLEALSTRHDSGLEGLEFASDRPLGSKADPSVTSAGASS